MLKLVVWHLKSLPPKTELCFVEVVFKTALGKCLIFLAWVFLKKTLRYCHCPGIFVCVVIVRSGAKTLTFSNFFVITEYLLQTQSSCSLSNKRGTHTSRGGYPPIFFDKVMPLFYLEFSKCRYSRALAPACSALVFQILQIWGNLRIVKKNTKQVNRCCF